MDMLWEMELDTILINYQESDNPLFVWEAFKYCRDNGKEIPDWVYEYFENVASNLLSLSKRDRMSDKRASAEVHEALGMKKLGSRDIFDRFSIYKRNQNIVSRISSLIIDENMKFTHATKVVSEEMHLGQESITNIFYNWVDKGAYTKEKRKKYGLPDFVLPPPDCLHPENEF